MAESLETLRKQLNQLFPNRSKVSDGGIGDAAHASRDSDHNPWVKDKKGVGVVTARDFTFDNNPKDGEGIDCNKLAEILVKNKDKRIKYIIWNKRIISSKQQPWVWRKYTGKNPHDKHLHLSVMPDQKLYDDAGLWDLQGLIPIALKLAETPVKAEPEKEPQQETTKVEISENEVKIETSSNPPAETTTEVVNAPPKEGSTATATKMTVLGFAVPAFVGVIVKSITDLISQGYISAAQVGEFVLNLIKENQKYFLILIAAVIVLLGVKKLSKQITLWLQMWFAGNKNTNNVEVKPQ